MDIHLHVCMSILVTQGQWPQHFHRNYAPPRSTPGAVLQVPRHRAMSRMAAQPTTTPQPCARNRGGLDAFDLQSWIDGEQITGIGGDNRPPALPRQEHDMRIDGIT
jgi:hypothetical protein